MGGGWVERLGWTLVHFLWQGTVVAALYTAARLAGARLLTAPARYALACLALAVMAALPVATYVAAAEPGPVPEALWPVAGVDWAALLPWLVALWAAGVGLFSLRLAAGWRRVHRLSRVGVAAAPEEWRRAARELARRMRVRQAVRLVASRLALTPAVVGWWRPVVLLPMEALTGLSEAQLRAVLAHELAHVLRRDYLANLLQGVTEAVLFYHPAVWWVSSRIRAEREACCDDLALAATGGDALSYARALAHLETARRVRLAVAATGGALRARVARLLGKAETPWQALPNPAAAVALGALWLAGMSAVWAHPAADAFLLKPHTAARRFVAPLARVVEAPRLPAPPRLRAALLFNPLLALPQAAAPEPDPAVVAGTVVGSSGTPVARAAVQLRAVERGSTERVVLTNADGRFRFEGLKPGSYRFQVTHNVMLDPKGTLYGPPAPERLELKPGERMEDVTARLLEPAVVRGRTVDEDGDPVAAVAVSLLRVGAQSGRRVWEREAMTTSDDNGEFRFGGLVPGRYLVRASRPLWGERPAYTGVLGSRPPGAAVPQVPIPAGRPGAKLYNPDTTYYGGSDSEAGAARIVLAPGEERQLGSIRMENRALVRASGRVLGEGAVAVAELNEGGSGFGGRAEVRADGGFEIAGLPAGREVVLGALAATGALLTRARVRLGEEDVQGVSLDARTAALAGRLRFEDEAPGGAAELRVMVSQARLMSSVARFAGVKPDGTFTLELPAGSYVLGVDGLPQGYYLVSARLDGKDLTRERLEWTTAGGGPLELVASRRAARVEGTLVDEEGRAAPGEVALVPDPAAADMPVCTFTARAGTDGRFELRAVPPGRYRLFGWEVAPRGAAACDPVYLQPFEGRTRRLELARDGRERVSVERVALRTMLETAEKAGLE
jgi:beta-lactamase regulating signal transducer with metallopeptidase domain/protocatechuate 3,4-dioxygenase beta subunit